MNQFTAHALRVFRAHSYSGHINFLTFMRMSTPDVLSSIGVFLIFLAFFLLTTDRLRADSKAYNLINIAGAGLLGIGAWMINSVPFVILEIIWVLAAVYGLIRSRKGFI